MKVKDKICTDAKRAAGKMLWNESACLWPPCFEGAAQNVFPRAQSVSPSAEGRAAIFLLGGSF